MTRIAVLGAGLAGCGTALELARRGVRATLVDQDPLPMNRASLRNEGKIHLGLIYAKDPSLATATLQLEGALRFRLLLARWIGSAAGTLPTSTPFMYLVARDSITSPAALEAHYSSVETLFREHLASNASLDYLGLRPDHVFRNRALGELQSMFRTQGLAAAFETIELAVDTDELARLLREAVAQSPHIEFVGGHRVEGVGRRGGGFHIEGVGPQGTWHMTVDQVVNALWEDRRRIDQDLAIVPDPNWLYRLKFRVIVHLPDALRGLPSATMVVGRYGDVVIRSNGTAYLSWYPAGLRGWTHALTVPPAWNDVCRGQTDAYQACSIATDTLAAIDAWYPGIGASKPLRVDAGVIVAYGQTDVDDVQSVLHDRSRIGVTSVDGYHSVEPGKLTTAPVVAQLAADRVVGKKGST